MDTKHLLPLSLSEQELAWVKWRFVDWGDCARVGHIPFLVMLQEVELVAELLHEGPIMAKVETA